MPAIPGVNAPAAGGVYPRFFMEAVEDPAASAANGRPICREEERVEIIMPGNQLTQPVHRVSDEHRQRWPQHYEAFRNNIEIAPEGTPLEDWPRLGRSAVMELKGLGFRIVEDIANAPDTVLQRLPGGGFRMREAAKAYLDDAASIALSEKLTFENDQLRAELSNVQRQLAEQSELLRQVHVELQTRRNALPPLETATVASIDPLSQMTQPAQVSESALAAFDTPRRRPGRPRKSGEEAAA